MVAGKNEPDLKTPNSPKKPDLVLVRKGGHPVVELPHLGDLAPLRHVPRVDEDVPVRDREGGSWDLGVGVADAHEADLRSDRLSIFHPKTMNSSHFLTVSPPACCSETLARIGTPEAVSSIWDIL